MSNYVNIKVSNADLPKPFIVMNDWMDDYIPHWEANGYCAINRKYDVYGEDYMSERLYHAIDVHWWLTYGELLSKAWPLIKNAYLQLEWTHKDDDVRIFGFDTNHYWDNAWTRDKDAVEREARYLQKQLLQFYVPTQEEIDEAEGED